MQLRILSPTVVVALAMLALGVTALRSGNVAEPDARREVAPQPVVGFVEDASGPVAAAIVRWKGAGPSVRTDQNGLFLLPPSEGASRRITAAAPGYFIAGIDADTPSVTIRLESIPTTDCLDYEWIDPAPDPDGTLNCAHCHEEIYRQWQTGGHSRAATNRRLINLFSGTDWHGNPDRGWNLLRENPHGGSICTACHAPSVSYDDPAFDDLRLVRGVPQRGVHCDYCHKIAEAPTDGIGLAHGVLGVELLRPRDGRLFFGPLDDDDRGHSVHSPLQKESRMCAACHEGTLFGVPVYTTYSEWLAGSDRQDGHTCQSCHMAPTGSLTNVAPHDAGLDRDPLTLASHGMAAGSRVDRLRQCLELDVTIETRQESTAVDVALLAREAGHRLPTGYIDRQLILRVEAYDAADRQLELKAGPRLPSPAGEDLAGRPGRLHAKVLTDSKGNSPAPFWRAGVRLADTRLFSNRPDQTHYVFPRGTHRVRVQVLYRRFWPQVAREKQWPDDEIVVIDRSYRVAD